MTSINILKKELLSDGNKELVWSLLYDGGLFNNIPSYRVDTVKSFLDNKIATISNSIIDTDTLTQLNKKIISEMIDDLNDFRVKTVTAEEISKDRQNKFDKRLNALQSDFNSMINLKKPIEIDFKDNIAEQNENIDKLLEQALSNRSTETNFFTENDINRGKSWIEGQKKLNIGEETLLTNTIEPSDNKTKRVHFQIDETKDIEQIKNTDTSAIIDTNIAVNNIDTSIAVNNIETNNFFSKLKSNNVIEENTKVSLDSNKDIQTIKEDIQTIKEDIQNIKNTLNDLQSNQLRLLEVLVTPMEGTEIRSVNENDVDKE